MKIKFTDEIKRIISDKLYAAYSCTTITNNVQQKVDNDILDLEFEINMLIGFKNKINLDTKQDI